jgi:CO/xanthine dehydrogenase FAD-binding subunit
MFLNYYRPKSLDEALKLLGEQEPVTVPLGGGTTLSQQRLAPMRIVDLQDLPLNHISGQVNDLHVGATATLQMLLENAETPPLLAKALQHEANLNIRNMATSAGSLFTADGKSLFATVLLALNARLLIMPGEKEIFIGNWLPQRSDWDRKNLIVEIIIPLQPVLSFEQVARSPEDRPIVCLATGEWPSGRTRIALGGTGNAPVLAFDGPDCNGANAAVENAFSQATDAFATGAYRSQVAKVFVQRLLLGENK